MTQTGILTLLDVAARGQMMAPAVGADVEGGPAIGADMGPSIGADMGPSIGADVGPVIGADLDPIIPQHPAG